MSDFSDSSTHLVLPYIQPAQAQKHVTHNEGMRRLDALVQLSVASAGTTTPPTMPAPGTRYILPAGTVGVWSEKPEGVLAVYEDNTWAYYIPRAGWTAWVEDEGQQRVFDGNEWLETGWPLDFQNLPQLGVQTTADATNRLAVSGDATLLTHAGAGHQLKLNKAAEADTASLVFQTGWSGRAEMGLPGNDNFEIKVSADGGTFHTALMAEADTGTVHFPQGATGLTPTTFGAGALLTVDYIAARGTDLFTNSTGLLGNNYNYPANFTFDPQITPNLPASYSFAGYNGGLLQMHEGLPIDPNRVYRLSSYLRQEGLPGDWSAFAHGERHSQYMGLMCFDRDGQTILAQHHMRYRHAGTDSLTTLAAPLAPGDTVVHLTDASGWNDSDAPSYQRGLILFGYRNALGLSYDHYSRLVEFDMFDLAGVDKTTHTITLKRPLPPALSNPDDPSGVWPPTTKIANSSNGAAHKYAFYNALHTPDTDRWYHIESYMGGIDRSGGNILGNFPPGTASAQVFWLPNYSNRSGGSAGHPDTGTTHRVWFAGVSVTLEPLAMMQPGATGAQEIKVPQGDFTAGQLGLAPATLQIKPL